MNIIKWQTMAVWLQAKVCERGLGLRPRLCAGSVCVAQRHCSMRSIDAITPVPFCLWGDVHSRCRHTNAGERSDQMHYGPWTMQQRGIGASPVIKDTFARFWRRNFATFMWKVAQKSPKPSQRIYGPLLTIQKSQALWNHFQQGS